MPKATKKDDQKVKFDDEADKKPVVKKKAATPPIKKKADKKPAVKTEVEEPVIEDVELDEEELEGTNIEEDSPLENIRLLFPECLQCAHLIEDMEDLFECIDDPQCPAKRMGIIFGRDPEEFIQESAKSILAAIRNGDSEAFEDAYAMAFKPKENRKYRFDVLALLVEMCDSDTYNVPV